MRIWLITIGEPVPIKEGAIDRLHRTGYFAKCLAAEGNQVTWWTSTFDHFRKKHLFASDATVRLQDGLDIRLLHGCGYARNLSFARLRDHYQVARRFKALAESELQPDILVAALPTVELCSASVAYGSRHGVPVVLDMRDMWPDIFVEAVPPASRPLARMLLKPMFLQASHACAGADAITGITDAFVDWGVRRACRKRAPLDRAFPLGYTSVSPTQQQIQEATEFWDARGVNKESSDLLFCYFGGIGLQLELDHIIQAARLLHERRKPVRLVICGSGQRLNEYRERSKTIPNILFPGWVDAAQISVLMRWCAGGIDPLPARYDFLATVNNKAIEYMSAGLPIISSPKQGVLFNLLKEQECGLSYNPGDALGLADLLSYLAANQTELRKMARNSKRLFRERYTAEAVYSEMYDYLGTVIRTIPHNAH